MYFASRLSISAAFGPGNLVFISGKVVLVIVCIKPPRTFEEENLMGRLSLLTRWCSWGSVGEKVPADRCGDASDGNSHFVISPLAFPNITRRSGCINE